jgi:D-alanyl-D-alanine carboxypeptidase
MTTRSRFAPSLLLVALLPSPVSPQTIPQDLPASIAATPAGGVLSAWLTAFNSADTAQMRAFDALHRGSGPALLDMRDFRETTGGFKLLRIEESAPASLTALLVEGSSDVVARLALSVSSEDPPRITDWGLRAIPRPSDLAIPRLSESEALAALRTRAEELAATDQWSGALLVARDGRILFEHASGSADREARTPLSLDTQFRLGSMNKMFTAIATLQLIEAGRLSLGDVVGDHLPDYPNQDVSSKVTIRHLLTHSGGTGDIFGPEFTRNRLTLREHSDYLRLYGARGVMHEPGAEHRYSNYGYVLLGAIIEEVSGMPYYDYVRSRIFQPAGMDATGSLPETEPVPQRARGYMRHEGVWESNSETLPWRGTAAGGGYSTVRDLLRFASALESGLLISDEMLTEATRPQMRQYGHGFAVEGEGPMRSYGHGGGAPGMNGDLRVYPEAGYVVIGLSNFDPPAATRLVQFFSNRMPTSP